MGFQVYELLHSYEFAPPAVSVAACPAQMLGLLTITMGKGFTVTILIAVFIQPLIEYPVTV
jgi:hypothetical protein